MTSLPLTLNPNWKGGRSVASNGYILIKQPGHPSADVRGYVYEHRLVAEQKIGRLLLQDELVHHVNGDKQDNRPENLEVTKGIAGHKVNHRKAGSKRRLPGENNPIVFCACGCGANFPKYDSHGRERKFIPSHNGRWLK